MAVVNEDGSPIGGDVLLPEETMGAVVWDGVGAQPPRPADYAAVTYIQPVEPIIGGVYGAIDGVDIWIDTTP